VYFKDLESQKAKNRVKRKLFKGLNLPQTPASIPVRLFSPAAKRGGSKRDSENEGLEGGWYYAKKRQKSS